MAHLVESMFSVRKTPWHGLGNVVQEAPSSEEAIIQAGLDWEVKQEPIFVGDELEQAEKFVANVRSDNGRVLGVVSERYQVVQNRDAFTFTDSLLGGGVRYETAGSLSGGEKIWLLARAPRQNILGDRIDPYLCFTNTHNGKGSVRVLLTPIRVICNNTLNMALQEADRSWSSRHIGNIHSKVEFARMTLRLTQNYMAALKKEAERLARKDLSGRMVKELVNELLPMPEYSQNNNQKRKNVTDLQKELLYRYNNAPDLKDLRGTTWGFIGAVSDFVTHTTPLRKTKTYRERNFEKVISGHNILDKAYRLVA